MAALLAPAAALASLLAGASAAAPPQGRCEAAAAAASAPSLLQLGSSARGPRLQVLTFTGPGKYERFAIKTWERESHFLGPRDNYTNVCEVGCGNLSVGGRRLTHMLPMTDREAFPSGACVSQARPCTGYDRAQMKLPWGLVHEWRSRRARGDAMPRWWFFRDDDTYFRADRLMDLVTGIDPMVERVIVGRKSSKPIHAEGWDCWHVKAPTHWHGGTGLLLSAALVDALVGQHAERWLKHEEEQIRLGCSFYDQHISTVLSWVRGVKEISNPVLFNSGFDGADIAKSCSGIDATTVTYHMETARQVLGDEAAVQRVSECFARNLAEEGQKKAEGRGEASARGGGGAPRAPPGPARRSSARSGRLRAPALALAAVAVGMHA